MYEIHSIDLKKVTGSDFINFLRMEIPERKGYGPIRFARVRYTLNGRLDEEENSLPIDLGKGIFTASLEDSELGEIPRDELELTLQNAAVEIAIIFRKKFDPSAILKSILKAYNYLEYDDKASEPPDVLRCRVNDSESPRHSEDIFDIAQRLKDATGIDYKVGSFSGSSNGDDNFDKTWTRFSLRKFKFEEKARNK